MGHNTYCRRCDRSFGDEHALQQHLDNSNLHIGARSASPVLHWCENCGRGFDSPNSLQEHRKIHRPRDLECFGCYRRFPSYSAMMIHLESGNCPCGTDEEDLRRFAAWCYQHKRYVVPGMEHYLRNGHQRSSADRQHFNYTLQCYECPQCDREFDKITGLQQHLSSPVHDPLAFRCPDVDCDVEFTCISGLLQHVESGRCDAEVAYGVGSIGKMLHYIFIKV